MNEDLVYRLRKRAEIRRQIPSRKSVQENKPDRIADLLEEAATEIKNLRVHKMLLGKHVFRLVEQKYKNVVMNPGDTLCVNFNGEELYYSYSDYEKLYGKKL